MYFSLNIFMYLFCIFYISSNNIYKLPDTKNRNKNKNQIHSGAKIRKLKKKKKKNILLIFLANN